MSNKFDLSEIEKEQVRLMRLNEFSMEDWQNFSVRSILFYLCDVTGGDKECVQDCHYLIGLGRFFNRKIFGRSWWG